MMRPNSGASLDASKQKIRKCNPYVTPSPTYLEAPLLPEPTTALLYLQAPWIKNRKNTSIEYKTIKRDSHQSWHNL